MNLLDKKLLLVYCYSNLPNFPPAKMFFVGCCSQSGANLPLHADIYFCRMSHRLTCPYRHILSTHRAPSFYCYSSHGLTCLNRCFLSSAMAYVGQTVHKDVFSSLFLPHSPHRLTCPQTQTFTFLCHGLHRPTRPHGHFLFIDIANTGLLAHTDAF